MNSFLKENPLLLLFFVSAIGYLVGRIKIKGTGLGISAVLFVGLMFGAMDPQFEVPEIIFQLGLVFFVYTIGLTSGPAFFQSFQKNGWRDIGFVLTMLTLSAIVAWVLHYFMGFNGPTTVGIYCGSSTNSPSLASAIELINQGFNNKENHIQDLVIGYTFSYPMGVLGVMLAIKLMEKIFRIDYEAEKAVLRKDYPLDENLTSRTLRVTNQNVFGKTLRTLLKDYQWNVVFGRMESYKHGRMMITHWESELHENDKITVVGTTEELDHVQEILGVLDPESLSFNRKEFDIVRIFVSNPDVVGKTISSLNLTEKYSALITRIRRGDIEMLAKSDTILEIGDRIRFVAKREDLPAIQKLFGDSYHAASKIDIFSFGLGIGLGLLLGMMELTLPGGLVFKAGYAGGPLLVGLILGALKRTGPIIWSLPYGTNVTLNQLGLILLLAVLGIRSGNTMMDSLSQGEWLPIFLGGSVLAISGAIISLWIGFKIFKIPFSLLLGFVSNQPAILEFVTDITKNKVPNIGYSFMFPISLVMKIIYAQILLLLLT
ncbi:MAG: AbrB family transcriptional regulator [Saprospiraceae bacterium]|nr:AbrB family transcriptional regulator [Saprospiraceae bacterium]MBK7524979.1 AbrB family transcriptional regulator [Saprospiraceae bacterium]MBK8370091.1 AbrB family transcriptional regulator [Saprospiraceae bacterium]MBK8818025.1 AbrB family transcriptional regulator [Saprospiraceae bacterium]MBK9042803.1 AbrB family transcriptional regulator [Saprospiraceae bacterium]